MRDVDREHSDIERGSARDNGDDDHEDFHVPDLTVPDKEKAWDEFEEDEHVRSLYKVRTAAVGTRHACRII